MHRLWEWADASEVPHNDLPRNKRALLASTKLALNDDPYHYPYPVNDIPREIGEMIHLTDLSFSIDAITRISLPEELSRLTGLKELHIDNYGEEEITLPKSIGNLRQLERLSLEGNINRDSIAPLLQNRGLRWLRITHNPHLQILPLTPNASRTIKEMQLISNHNLLLTPAQLQWAVGLRDDQKGYERIYCFRKPDGTAGEHSCVYGQKFQYYCVTPSHTADSRIPPPVFPTEEQMGEIGRLWEDR
jgi:Leucine-rich repeat (LRR) protein